MIAKYIENRRGMEFADFKREDLGPLVRYTPTDSSSGLGGLVCWTQLESANLEETITEQVAYFEGRCGRFEWKVYDFDRPADLRQRLLDHGFEQGTEEALMILDVAKHGPKEPRKLEGIEIRRIDDPADFPSIVKFQERIWNRSFAWLADHLLSSRDTRTIIGAYSKGVLIGKGWIDYATGSCIADLHGGAVLPEFRGRGIYSRLFEERVVDARNRGMEFIAVDAAPMSRPILERKNFQFLCMTYPMARTLDGGSPSAAD